MASTLDSYAPVKGEISRRLTGSLVAFETGETTAYGIGGVQDRGSMFIGPGVEVYAGMIVGQCNRNEDMAVNVCKKKAADQYARSRLRRRHPPRTADGSVARAVHGIPCRRRAAGGHAEKASVCASASSTIRPECAL